MTWVWAVVYAGLLLVLFVRVDTGNEPATHAPLHAVAGDPLRLIALHHALFYLLLLGTPLEVAILGSTPDHRAIGACCFAAGVALYRAAGRALGESLSPFVEPRAGAPLVTRGPYRYLRHPMYLGQGLIAVGAPLTLGARWFLVLSATALVVLGIRIWLEEDALARTFPEYSRYAARAKRIVPFLF